jgi:murein DD-endopeptidase MepM/ murein hydrolase activator NlpD
LLVIALLAACVPTTPVATLPTTTPAPLETEPLPTLLPTREEFNPGQLVDYTAQDGDTVPALAAHFNTHIAEILAANPVLPQTTTTLPPGLPLKIPIYYLPLWGSSYHILPDALFVNGPAARDFNTQAFVSQSSGWLKSYRVWAYGGWRTGGELVDYIATSYSLSPRLLLALLEYQLGALTNPAAPTNVDNKALGFDRLYHENLYLQILMAADTLNGGYYGWRTGDLLQTDLRDGSLVRFDPWLNAGTVGLQYYFSQTLSPDGYARAVSGIGLNHTYEQLFGSTEAPQAELIPGSLTQPAMLLPFAPGKVWSYTGAPHPAWGENEPWAAVDFAPPAEKGGCAPSEEWVTAVADGVLSRTELGLAMLDLDGDGDERTGWVVLYLHLSRYDAAPEGRLVTAGAVIGHPSCERGNATGTHVHIARKYNGEWIPADSVLPFDMEGWIPHTSGTPYKGTLTRFSKTLTACTCADAETQLESGK